MVRIISEHFVLVNFTYWWSPLWWSVASGCGLFPCQWPISSKWVWSQCKWLIDGWWVWSVSVSMANQWQVGTVVCFRQGWWWVSICGGLIHCAMAVNHFNVWYCQFQFAVAWSILFYIIALCLFHLTGHNLGFLVLWKYMLEVLIHM